MSTPPPGGDEQPPPPPGGDGRAGEQEPPEERPAWAWEPDLTPDEPAFAAPEPPPVAPESGQEMLQRLYERGLISEEEYLQRSGQAAPPIIGAEPLEPPGEQLPAAAAAGTVPPPPPPLADALEQPGWAPPPPPPADERYPMHFDIAYPDGMSRGTTFIRVILLIPVLLFASLLQYFSYAAHLVGFTTVFWRKKYPDWLFRGLSGAFGFQARAWAYGLLLTDRFPGFSPEDSPVTLEYDEPPSGYLSRWRVLFWKLILLIPHFIVLWLLSFAVFAVTVIAWFGILFTGNYPRGLFQFGVGVQRWWWRVAGYFAGFNDRYPPYALSAKAGPAGNGATVTSGFVGAAAAAGFAALIVVAVIVSNRHYTQEVDYAALQQGRPQPAWNFPAYGDEEVRLTLARVYDPGDDLVQVLRPASSERVVVFQWTLVNRVDSGALVEDGSARLKFAYEDEDGDDRERSATASILTVNNVVAPATVRGFGTATVQAVFVIPEDAEPLELRFRDGFAGGGIKYVFD